MNKMEQITNQAELERRIEDDYSRKLIRISLIGSLGPILLSSAIVYGGFHLKDKTLPEPIPIVQEYKEIKDSLKFLEKRLTTFDELSPLFLAYVDENRRQELQSSFVGIHQNLQEAIQFARADSMQIAHYPEVVEYTDRQRKALQHQMNALYLASLPPLSGLVYFNNKHKKIRRQKDKQLKNLENGIR